MTPRDTLQRIQRHAGVYRRLTRLFPAGFRSEYEEPMVQLFRDHCREAMESDRTTDWLALWSRTLADAGVSLIREHASALRRRFQNWESPFCRCSYDCLQDFSSLSVVLHSPIGGGGRGRGRRDQRNDAQSLPGHLDIGQRSQACSVAAGKSGESDVGR
jgi:hypothetical protein